MSKLNIPYGNTRENSTLFSISEFEEIRGINNIQDIIKIRNFVFSTVPLLLKDSTDIKLSMENLSISVFNLYKLFLSKKVGGWCGLNVDFFQTILYWYQVPARPYNFGIAPQGITHTGVVVEYDGEEFFMDPYYAVHYAHRDGFLLTFKHLMSLIADRKFDRIVPIFSDIRKPVEQRDGTFSMMTPQEIQKSTMFMSHSSLGRPYEDIMNEVFGQTNPLLLMLIKIVG